MLSWREARQVLELVRVPCSNAQCPATITNKTKERYLTMVLRYCFRCKSFCKKTKLFSQVLLGLCWKTHASLLSYTALATRWKLRANCACRCCKHNSGCSFSEAKCLLIAHAQTSPVIQEHIDMVRWMARKRGGSRGASMGAGAWSGREPYTMTIKTIKLDWPCEKLFFYSYFSPLVIPHPFQWTISSAVFPSPQ